MAAAIKALNARIRSNPVSDYLCSTHFWGPASNFGIPIAAVMDTQKDPDIISGNVTAALLGYSGVFMRYSMMVTPKNYLLFGCHVVNFSAQSMQAYRYTNYWYMGGREKALQARAGDGLGQVESSAGDFAQKEGGAISNAAAQAEQGAKGIADQAKAQVEKVTR